VCRRNPHVHTPEFTFEHEIGLVAEATRQRGIDYPVALDNDYAIWNAFENHYWPALYFVDREGIIRDSQFDEGRYEESERLIQRLLGIERELAPIEANGAEAPADWEHLGTPETYLGYGRAERFASRRDAVSDRSRVYQLPERMGSNEWALAGEWTIEREKILLGKAGGSLACRYEARDAHLVLSSAAPQPIPFRVLLDGAAPGSSHGVDVDEEGSGTLREGRLYQLVRADGAIRERTFEITFLHPGAEAYVLTFG
jgi:hypothetical protein